MKHRRKIYIFFLILFGFTNLLFSQETIVDSVYSDMNLDGHIVYWRVIDQYETIMVNYEMPVGDFGIPNYNPPWIEPNSTCRSYISFELPDIPEGYHIENATLRLYQNFSKGDNEEPYFFDFPVWDIPGGENVQCILSHIDYGDELDVDDWEKGDAFNPSTFESFAGVVTDNGTIGYRFIDVTDNVLLDYQTQRSKTQYRISFTIDTDWDAHYDYVSFCTKNHTNYMKFPMITFTFCELTHKQESEISEMNTSIVLYPNPIAGHDEITLSILSAVDPCSDISLYNIKGQKMFQKRFISTRSGINTIPIKTDNLSSGIYYLKVSNSSEEICKKFIIMK